MSNKFKTAIAIVLLSLVAIAVGLAAPGWFRFLAASALAKGLVVLGVVVLLRAGLVTFGQGLYYCIGGYTVGLVGLYAGVTDAVVLLFLAALVGGLVGSLFGLFMSRYRQIFFAMFSLALSMILFGILSKTEFLGSTDGFNVVQVTLFGTSFDAEGRNMLIYILACSLAGLAILLGQAYVRSPLGYASVAFNNNEVRVEFLGLAPNRILYVNYVIASTTASLGGGLVAMAIGHVGPEMAFWTQSGEFVFIALLGGAGHAAAPFLGAGVFELLRSYALEWMPEAWQMTLGLVLIIVIVFLPKGLWSLFSKAVWSGVRA